jgi:hypothetical protein
MTEELEQLMTSLHLKRTMETYAEQLKAAEKEDITYSDFLSRLLPGNFPFWQTAGS